MSLLIDQFLNVTYILRMHLNKSLRTYFYNIFNLKKLESSVTLNRQQGPVVTLTTVPKRISNIKPTLVSLLKQTVTPCEIHINVSSDFFKTSDIPDFLIDLDIIKIKWVPKDYGPATKFIYTLDRFKNSDKLIIVVDDDMIYPKNLIENLVNADKQHHHKASICINGLKVPSTLRSKDRQSDKQIKSGIKRVAIVEGCGGYTLRPQFLDVDSLINIKHAPTRSHFDDDFWISGHLSRNNISKYQIPSGKRRSTVNTIESAISGDREQLQTDLMLFFKDDWKNEEIEYIK